MTTTPANPSRVVPSAKYANGAEWLHALGDIPLERVVMDPPPGTATEPDLLTLVDRDKRICEFVDGTLVEKPAGSKESYIAGVLITALNTFVIPRKLGVVTGEAGPFRLRANRIRLPDVAFISIRDLPGGKLPDEPILALSPALAVEVLSESNTKAEMRQKTSEYFEAGSRLVWLIYPKTRSVAVYESPSDEPARLLRDDDMLDGGSVLPGFTLPIADLFAELP
jgi:Uma2 family endonuclease